MDTAKSSKFCTVLKGVSKIGISKNDDDNWVYFDFSKEKGGSIIDFVMQQEKCNLGHARVKLRSWASSEKPKQLQEFQKYLRPTKSNPDRTKASIEFAQTRLLDKPHRFLRYRSIKSQCYLTDRFKGKILTDGYKNVLFPHADQEGFYGFEKRNFKFNGYTTYGQRCLWFSNLNKTDKRFFFSESGLDCLAFFQLHNDGRTAYFSVGGQISDYQLNLIKAVRMKNPDVEFILGFDNDHAGNKLVEKILLKIGKSKTNVMLPEQEGYDWNDVLKEVKR